MLILLLKNHAHPCTCDWLIDHSIQFMRMLVLCQNYTYILALSHTHTHTSTTTYLRVFLLSGTNWRQHIWQPGGVRPQVWGHCEEKETQRSFPPAREVSRERWGKKNQTNPKRALEMCVVGGCHLLAPGTSPRRGTGPPLLGEGFSSF